MSATEGTVTKFTWQPWELVNVATCSYLRSSYPDIKSILNQLNNIFMLKK